MASIIPLNIGNDFSQPFSVSDLGRGFKLNTTDAEHSIKDPAFTGTVEEVPLVTTRTVSTVVRDSSLLEEAMEIKGELGVTYGPMISGEGRGSFVSKNVSTSKKIVHVYRSRHHAYFDRHS